MKKIVSILLLLIVLIGCSSSKSLRVPYNSEEFKGKNYIDIVEELEKEGFKNFNIDKIEDLTSDSKMRDGTIEIFNINGITQFEKNHAFPIESQVNIVCHIIPKLNIPFSSTEVKTMETEDIIEKLKESGFSNISTKEVYDIDPDKSNDLFRNDVTIESDWSYDSGEEFSFDGKIVITTHYPYEKYEAIIHLDFIPNLVFNKYDVDVYIDSLKKESLKHGEDKDLKFKLKEGSHTIKFTKSNSSSVDGEVVLELDNDVEVEYRISCYGEYIEVKTAYIDFKTELKDGEIKMPKNAKSYRYENYKNVIEELESLGFTDIKEQIQYDIIWGITKEGDVENLSINGNSDFNRGDIFNKNDPIIVTYHMKYEDDPNKTNNDNSTNSSSNSSSEKVDINEYVEFLNEFAKQYETENSKFEAKRFLDTVFVNNITTSIRDLQTLAIAGNQQALDSWNNLISSATELNKAVRKDMNSRGLSSYNIVVDILDDTNTEMVLAEIKNGEVVFDGVNGINKR